VPDSQIISYFATILMANILVVSIDIVYGISGLLAAAYKASKKKGADVNRNMNI